MHGIMVDIPCKHTKASLFCRADVRIDGWPVTMEDTFQWWKIIWMEGSVCWLLILYLILFYCFAGMVCTCTGIRNGTHKKIKIIEIIVANLVVASWLPEWRPTATPLLVPQTSICFIWTFKASISPHLGRATGLEWIAPCTKVSPE